MTTKYVEWCSHAKLPCSYAARKEVVLCLQSSDLVRPFACPALEDSDYSLSFIDAEICQAYAGNINCQNTTWYYKFSYDSDDLAPGVSALSSGDITGAFCKNCETDWIDQRIGNEVYTYTDLEGNTFLVSQHGCTYPLGTGAALSNYLFLSTSSIDVTDCGSPEHTIEMFINISEDVGNILEIHGDGLYATVSSLNGTELSSAITLTGSAGFVGDTSDGSDTYRFYICPGGNIEDPTRGAFITVYGNESGIGIPGGINFAMGNIAGAHMDFGVGGAASSYLRFYGGNTLQLQIQTAFLFASKNSGNEISGAGAALLGANCPAVTVGAPYTWLKVQTSDGSTGYIPVWK